MFRYSTLRLPLFILPAWALLSRPPRLTDDRVVCSPREEDVGFNGSVTVGVAEAARFERPYVSLSLHVISAAPWQRDMLMGAGVVIPS